jgi:hypothetical protein
MKAAAGISTLLFLSFGVSAQTVTRSFGSVVFPGGTSATTPGITRNFGSVVFPGGSPTTPTVRTGPPPAFVGTPRAGGRPVSINNSGQNFRRNSGPSRIGSRNGLVYAYPVFVGNYYDTGTPAVEPAAAPQMAPPPMMTMYNPETARPVMIQVPQEAPIARAVDSEPARESDHYLLAFKDHTVYSAVAYWFDGDTLHYFTTGSTHNQASISLLDRELTVRLNKEMGTDFKIPE